MRIALRVSAALFCAGLAVLATAPTKGGWLPLVKAGYQGPGDISALSGVAKGWWGLRAYSNATRTNRLVNVCNASDANCADVGSLSTGNFDVATAQGSPLNCGGAGGTCTIKTFYDQVSTHNKTQATIANRATLVFNCLNTSLSCAQVAAAQSYTATGISQATPYTVNISADRTTSFASSMTLFAINGSGAMGFFLTGTAGVALFANFAGSVVGNMTNNVFQSWNGAFNGGSSSMWVNNTQVTGTTGSTTLSGTLIWYSQLNGRFVEDGIWSGDQSSNVATLNSNIRGYWGF